MRTQMVDAIISKQQSFFPLVFRDFAQTGGLFSPKIVRPNDTVHFRTNPILSYKQEATERTEFRRQVIPKVCVLSVSSVYSCFFLIYKCKP